MLKTTVPGAKNHLAIFGRWCLLMVQKSGKLTSWGKGGLSHDLQGFSYIQTVVGLGISEPTELLQPEETLPGSVCDRWPFSKCRTLFGLKGWGGETTTLVENLQEKYPKILYMGVSKNRGTTKSSILIGFSIINHPFWGIPIFGNTQIDPQVHHESLRHFSPFGFSLPPTDTLTTLFRTKFWTSIKRRKRREKQRLNMHRTLVTSKKNVCWSNYRCCGLFLVENHGCRFVPELKPNPGNQYWDP